MATQARILDRRRFERLSGRSDSSAALAALDAYRNADGGYGWGLELDQTLESVGLAGVDTELRCMGAWRLRGPEGCRRSGDRGARRQASGRVGFEVPVGLDEIYHGPDGYCASMEVWADSFQNWRAEVEEVIEEGHDRFLIVARHSGEGIASGVRLEQCDPPPIVR